MTDKKIRGNWHKENRPFVFKYFSGICQTCKKQIQGKFDIHHLHYNVSKTSLKGKLYELPAKDLIENGVITLICRPCHILEHTCKDINNRKPLENTYPCEICGRNERGIFDRKTDQKLDKLLCRKCFLDDKHKINQMVLF
jgi:hypothetical protein